MTSSDDPTRNVRRDDAAPLDPAPSERPAAERPAAERPAADHPAADHPADERRAGSPAPTGRRAAERPAEDRPAEDRRPVEEEPVATGGGGKTAGMWIGLILGAIILVMLLIFVIQNNVPAGFQYFGAEFDLPLGVAMLLAAIAGALVMALVGSVRMIQMSMTIRRMRKQQEKVRRAAR